MLIVHLFVSYAHVNPCHFFSSFLCQGFAAASACCSSWTFLLTFLGKIGCGGMLWGGIGWVDIPKVCGVFTMGRVRKCKSR